MFAPLCTSSQDLRRLVHVQYEEIKFMRIESKRLRKCLKALLSEAAAKRLCSRSPRRYTFSFESLCDAIIYRWLCAFWFAFRAVSNKAQEKEMVLAEHDIVDETARGRGPRAALKEAHLGSKSEAEKDDWIQRARIKAVLGSCSLSMKSVRSGMLCHMSYIGAHT